MLCTFRALVNEAACRYCLCVEKRLAARCVVELSVAVEHYVACSRDCSGLPLLVCVLRSGMSPLCVYAMCLSNIMSLALVHVAACRHCRVCGYYCTVLFCQDKLPPSCFSSSPWSSEQPCPGRPSSKGPCCRSWRRIGLSGVSCWVR